ncbi:MAG: prepilin-type N-terminal cleavage/methylation domain-containing protein [Coriobacteriia bacterium]|nr:prepilin-type N-terminal cleavage/methylation domain-containing protein [Coriobacteriia bacterium]
MSRLTIRWRERKGELGGDAGFTLVELMIAVSLLSLVLATAYMVLNSVSSMSDRVSAREMAASSANLAIERMTRELRQAQELSTAEGAGVFRYNEPQRASFYIDLDHNGTPERVTYYVSGTTLYRTVAVATITYPGAGNFGADSAPTAVLSGLDPGWTPNVFVYYDNSSVPAVVSSANPDEVSAVEITVVAQGRSGSITASATSTTWVRIRSVHNDIAY